jgi:hypothetical protein
MAVRANPHHRNPSLYPFCNLSMEDGTAKNAKGTKNTKITVVLLFARPESNVKLVSLVRPRL